MAFERTVGHEGDFSDDPLDSGGATRYGVTEQTARANGYAGPMREMPFSFAKTVYRIQYWDLLRLDAVAAASEAVAIELFDSAVNCGAATAGKWLQRSLNALNDGASRWPDVEVDGLIGPVTLMALRGQALGRPHGDSVLLKALNSLQGAHYIGLAEERPKDERFVSGWIDKRVSL